MADVDLLDLFDLPAAPAMNEDLAAWQQEAERSGVPATAADPSDGACVICRAATSARCVHCGRGACSRHLGAMTRLCDRCADGDDAEAAKGHRDDLGIAWID